MMTPFLLYGGAGCLLVALGLYSLTVGAHIYRRILSWNTMGSGVFLIIGAISRRAEIGAPIDPLPQALVITGIVVSVSATALALAIARRIKIAEESGE